METKKRRLPKANPIPKAQKRRTKKTTKIKRNRESIHGPIAFPPRKAPGINPNLRKKSHPPANHAHLQIQIRKIQLLHLGKKQILQAQNLNPANRPAQKGRQNQVPPIRRPQSQLQRRLNCRRRPILVRYTPNDVEKQECMPWTGNT